jgi:membrane-associated HD superfamily phosphohydrolase
MADRRTYIQLLEHGQQIDFLLNSPEIEEDEKKELAYMWDSLKSREESKFDAIIGIIKECDKQIDQLETDIKELKINQEHWKKKRNNIINIIKMAYERNLISSKPTGNKYQATIKAVRSKLIPNFHLWNEKEKQKFGLKKSTIIKRIFNNKILQEDVEELPDKERMREIMEDFPDSGPADAKLIKRVSLAYRLRKRLKKGI